MTNSTPPPPPTPAEPVLPPESPSKPVPRRRSRPSPIQPVLRFSPTAWAKLQFFCHHGETEIGGFGVAAQDDLLRVEEFVTVKQATIAVSVAFDDAAVAEFFDAQVDAGRRPEQFGRIWCHSHPGDSPTPSSIDEDTFDRVFGGCQWAVMFILARGGDTYARLRFNVGPGGSMLIPVEVEYRLPFAASDHSAWLAEYEQNIHPLRERPYLTQEHGLREVIRDDLGEPPMMLDDVFEPDLFEEFHDPYAWEEEVLWP